LLATVKKQHLSTDVSQYHCRGPHCQNSPTREYQRCQFGGKILKGDLKKGKKEEKLNKKKRRKIDIKSSGADKEAPQFSESGSRSDQLRRQ
jgi:hypothetical protein